MKKVFILIILFISSSFGLYSQNLILNPSFEEGVTQDPSFWEHSPEVDGISFCKDNIAFQTGKYSCSITKNNSSEVAYWIQTLNPEKGKIYTLTIFFKSYKKVLTAYSGVNFWENGARYIPGYCMYGIATNTKTWTKLEFNFYLPNKVDSISIILSIKDSSGKIFYDDIELKEYVEPNDYFAFGCGEKEPYLQSPDGLIYLPDREYTPENKGGYINSQPSPIEPSGAFLSGGVEGRYWFYMNERYGFDEYRFDVENGYYAVNLHFSENVEHGSGKRIMDFYIEDELALKDLDVYWMVGRNYIYIKRLLAEVKDGQLNVNAIAKKGLTMLSAISAVRIEPDNHAPKQPTNFTITDGFYQIILGWDPNYEKDFRGYAIYKSSGGAPYQRINVVPHALSRYIDFNVIPGVEYSYKISAVDLWDNESPLTNALSTKAVTESASNLPIYSLYISDENLSILNDSIWSEEYVPAIFQYKTQSIADAEVRYRGNATREFSKKNYKIRFNKNNLFNNSEKLNLYAELPDASMMIDELTYALKRTAGVLTPDTYPVQLKLNGFSIGVYLQKEQEDDYFLLNHDLENSNIYRSVSGFLNKCPTRDEYSIAYEKENNSGSGYDDLINFIEFINDASDEDFKEQLPNKINIEEYLTQYAILNCVADEDQTGHNFCMLRNLSDGKWRFITYDHNLTFYHSNTPIDLYTKEHPSLGGNQNYLFDRMFHIDEFRYFYINKLLEFVNTIFSPEQMEQRIDDYFNLIGFDAFRDILKYGGEDNQPMADRVNYLKNFVRERVEYINAEAPKFLPIDYFPLKNIYINEIMPVNLSTLQNDKGEYEPWIEIFNDNIIPIDLSGCYLTNDTSNPSLWKFPPYTIIQPKEFILVWADGNIEPGKLHASFKLHQNGGCVALMNQDGKLMIDSIYYGKMDNDISLGRLSDASDTWTEMNTPTPKASNTVPNEFAPVLINEIMADNTSYIMDKTGNYSDWIELYYNSSDTASLGGYYLTDDLASPRKWQFPPNTRIYPGGYLLLWANDNPGGATNYLSFKLDKSGDVVALYAPNGKTVIDSKQFGPQKSNISFGRNGDGNSQWVYFTEPSPNNANTVLSSFVDVVINEFMALNNKTISDESGKFADWIELYNKSDIEADIGGYYLTDNLDNLTKWQIPDGTKIAPKGFILFWADDDGSEGPLHTNFKLSGSGEEIGLTAPDGITQIDFITFGEQITDVSYGRNGDGNSNWISFNEPTPSASNLNTGIKDTNIPLFRLEQNYPNPFFNTTRIDFEIFRPGFVTLQIFDRLGNKIKTMVKEYMFSGNHSVIFDSGSLPSGIYYYRLECHGNISQSKAFSIIK